LPEAGGSSRRGPEEAGQRGRGGPASARGRRARGSISNAPAFLRHRPPGPRSRPAPRADAVVRRRGKPGRGAAAARDAIMATAMAADQTPQNIYDDPDFFA